MGSVLSTLQKVLLKVIFQGEKVKLAWAVFDDDLRHVSEFSELKPTARPKEKCPVCNELVVTKLEKRWRTILPIVKTTVVLQQATRNVCLSFFLHLLKMVFNRKNRLTVTGPYWIAKSSPGTSISFYLQYVSNS